MHSNDNGSDLRFFGFSHGEWRRALGDDPAALISLERFFASFPDKATSKGLGHVGIDSLLALAKVSPEFARRVVAELDGTTPAWRKDADQLAKSEAAGAYSSHAWKDFLSLVDEVGK